MASHEEPSADPAPAEPAAVPLPIAQVDEESVLTEIRRELAAARGEIEWFQDSTCKMQEDFYQQLEQLQITNEELSTKLKVCLEDKDNLETSLATLKNSCRPPTMTDLKDRRGCTPLAILLHNDHAYAFVEKTTSGGHTTRRFWSIAEDVPGGRLGDKLCDGDEWGSFRAEEEIFVLKVPVYVSMRKDQLLEFEQQVMELNRQRVLLEQRESADDGQPSRVKVLVRDSDDSELKAQLSILQDEVRNLQARISADASRELAPAEDAVVAEPPAFEDSRVAELTRKLEMVETQLKKSERRCRQLEHDLSEHLARQQNRSFYEQSVIQPVPLRLPLSEPPSSADRKSVEYKLSQRNEELELQLKKLSDELVSNIDKHQYLQLKQSVVYMLSQIPENFADGLELTIQTVIGLLGLDKEAKERLAIKRSQPVRRGWR